MEGGIVQVGQLWLSYRLCTPSQPSSPPLIHFCNTHTSECDVACSGATVDAAGSQAAVASYANITELPSASAQVNANQTYIFVMYNPHNYTVEWNYSLSALTTTASGES